jgi:ABC-type multidrug transport system fused ATPase/permease subunit
LADYLLPQRGRVLALTALIVASIAARLITPQLLRWFIDAVALGDDIRTDAG